MTSTQKRSRDEAKAKYEAEMTEQAPKMLELAQKALEAVQAMMALETQMKEKNGDNCTVFSSDDERTLKEAEWAINIAFDIAEEHVERAKKAKTDA